MTEDVYPLIVECVKDSKPSDPVFTRNDGSPVEDFREAWSKMCESAKVDVLWHDFRRTAVRNLIRAGVSRDVARKISGHETESIFSRYNITDENDMADAAKDSKLAGNWPQQVQSRAVSPQAVQNKVPEWRNWQTR
jgi:hypothetical protein